MGKVIGIGGETSTGKTTSFRNLDPATTVIISPNESVDIPFPNGKHYSVWNKESNPKGNIYKVKDFRDVFAVIRTINDKRTDVKNLIVDDTTHFIWNRIQSDEFKAQSAGAAARSKWSDLGSDYHKSLLSHSLREDLNMVIVFHTKVIDSPGEGKQWDIQAKGNVINEIKPVSWFNTFLQTRVTKDDDGNIHFQFVTKNDGEYNLAKSPLGMFEETYIENNLQAVFDKMDEYYNSK